MTKSIYDWLLNTDITEDNIIQWEGLANSVWIHSKLNPVYSNSNLINDIFEKAKTNSIEIPSIRTNEIFNNFIKTF